MATTQSLLAPSGLRSLPTRQKRSAEVIVIGGGVSGLQAAYDIQQAGLTCLVLEAQTQVGGHYSHSGGARVDLANQPRCRDLVRALGLEVWSDDFADYELAGSVVSSEDFNVKNLDEEDTRSYLRVGHNLDGLCQNIDVNRPAQLLPNYGNTSVHELVVSQGATSAVQKIANEWTSLIFGLSSTNVSAIGFLLHCKCAGGLRQALPGLGDESEDVRLLSTCAEVGEKLASRLHPETVQVSQTVQQIDQASDNKCVLTTLSGDVFECTQVILTIPLIQYRDIQFIPELSDDKQWLCNTEEHCSCAEMCAHYLAMSAAHLRNLERDGWQPEGSIHFSGSDAGYVWRGHMEGALTSGSRGAEEVLDVLWPTPDGVRFAKL